MTPEYKKLKNSVLKLEELFLIFKTEFSELSSFGLNSKLLKTVLIHYVRVSNLYINIRFTTFVTENEFKSLNTSFDKFFKVFNSRSKKVLIIRNEEVIKVTFNTASTLRQYSKLALPLKFQTESYFSSEQAKKFREYEKILVNLIPLMCKVETKSFEDFERFENSVFFNLDLALKNYIELIEVVSKLYLHRKTKPYKEIYLPYGKFPNYCTVNFKRSYYLILSYLNY
jgi:hypothetical protein